jgi:hypothetical protein
MFTCLFRWGLFLALVTVIHLAVNVLCCEFQPEGVVFLPNVACLVMMTVDNRLVVGVGMCWTLLNFDYSVFCNNLKGKSA